MRGLRKRHGRASRQSEKARLMGRIRRLKAAAVSLRLRGLIPGAMRYEEDLDRSVAIAEGKGWADAAMGAEERGEDEGRKHAERM